MSQSMPAEARAAPTLAPTCNMRTLDQIDREYEQLGCLGYGGFGSVFLARKETGRRVALKLMLLDGGDEDRYETFTRELNAVVRLNTNGEKSGGAPKTGSEEGRDHRNLAIIFFEEWFTGPGFACIVMNFADGGTLSQEISSRNAALANKDGAAEAWGEPYAERRIAWYALQLSEALAYAHERGVAHHDVKSSNVLIDAAGGGRLLLADFGTSVALSGEESVGFTKNYAAPELLAAQEREEYGGMQPEKIDAFGLGCILFELLACRDLQELSDGDKTLARFVCERGGANAALNLSCMRLPWLPESNNADNGAVGYSHALGSLVKTLLEPRPEVRWAPSQLQDPLRNDPLSPLLTHTVVAARSPVPGAPVTVDNVQLGMFVQRGHHWDDENADGGPGSIGVVVKLDADAGYTEVAFPSRSHSKAVESICSRIGAGNKFELQVGPTPLPDFYSGTDGHKWNGMLRSSDSSRYCIGQMINDNCMVVGIPYHGNIILVAPMAREQARTLPPPPLPSSQGVSFASPREPRPPPSVWLPSAGFLVEVNDPQERHGVARLFHCSTGGMDIGTYEITSLKRVQTVDQWETYARSREAIAMENWGVTNERRLFHGTWSTAPEKLISQGGSFYERLIRSSKAEDNANDHIDFSGQVSWSQFSHHRHLDGDMRVVLSRVTLGRVFKQNNSSTRLLNYHSDCRVDSNGTGAEIFRCRAAVQAFPEYVVTYRNKSKIPSAGVGAGGRRRRIVRSKRPPRYSAGMSSSEVGNLASFSRAAIDDPSGSYSAAMAAAKDKITKPGKSSPMHKEGSATKLCVVCVDKEVCRVLLPCGHPCLCMECSTEQGIAKLRRRCPECRGKIKQVAQIYGRVVND